MAARRKGRRDKARRHRYLVGKDRHRRGRGRAGVGEEREHLPRAVCPQGKSAPVRPGRIKRLPRQRPAKGKSARRERNARLPRIKGESTRAGVDFPHRIGGIYRKAAFAHAVGIDRHTLVKGKNPRRGHRDPSR